MLSHKAKYGLKAMMFLAERGSQTGIPIREIARHEGIPRRFLDAILLALKKQGLLVSKVGKSGGYRLARPPAEITAGEIIRILDGPLAPLPCASASAFRPCTDCSDVRTCRIRYAMLEVRDAMAAVLDNTTLVEMSTPALSSLKGQGPMIPVELLQER